MKRVINKASLGKSGLSPPSSSQSWGFLQLFYITNLPVELKVVGSAEALHSHVFEETCKKAELLNMATTTGNIFAKLADEAKKMSAAKRSKNKKKWTPDELRLLTWAVGSICRILEVSDVQLVSVPGGKISIKLPK